MQGSTRPAAAQPSRLREWWGELPLATAFLLAVCVGVHAINFLFTVNIGVLAISAARVLYNAEIYRIFSSAFTHGGLLHILMNMMSLLQLGPSLEKTFGTLQFFIASMWCIILTGVLYITISWLLAFYILGQPAWLWSSGVGYSGVLFAYAVLESYHSNVPTRSVFGIFSVPSKVYPWALLVILQFMVPNISFLGHLSGILVGVLIVYGGLRVLLPSPACLEELQGYSVLRRIASWPQYVPCIDRDMTVSSAQGGALWGAMKGGLLWIFTIVWNVLATLLHIVGCPPERLADSLRALNPFSARHTPTTSFSGMPVSTSVNTDVERGQRGAYTQLPQSQL